MSVPQHSPGEYVPDRGDLIWLSFDPRVGREQAGHRPALVLSPAVYNGRVRLAIVCPITSRIKGYPFEVRLPDHLAVSGVVLVDHVRSVDWVTRRAAWADRAPEAVMWDVETKLVPLLGLRW